MKRWDVSINESFVWSQIKEKGVFTQTEDTKENDIFFFIFLVLLYELCCVVFKTQVCSSFYTERRGRKSSKVPPLKRECYFRAWSTALQWPQCWSCPVLNRAEFTAGNRLCSVSLPPMMLTSRCGWDTLHETQLGTPLPSWNHPVHAPTVAQKTKNGEVLNIYMPLPKCL